MSDEVSPEATVSYTMREMLDEQTKLLRGIDQKVDGKADKADVVELGHEVRGHRDRIISLESSREWGRRVLAASGVILLAVSGVMGGLISAHII